MASGCASLVVGLAAHGAQSNAKGVPGPTRDVPTDRPEDLEDVPTHGGALIGVHPRGSRNGNFFSCVELVPPLEDFSLKQHHEVLGRSRLGVADSRRRRSGRVLVRSVPFWHGYELGPRGALEECAVRTLTDTEYRVVRVGRRRCCYGG